MVFLTGGGAPWAGPRGRRGRRTQTRTPAALDSRLAATSTRFGMQISARNALAAAALAALAAGAAAQDNVLENLADGASDALTGFFANLNSAFSSITDLSSFA